MARKLKTLAKEINKLGYVTEVEATRNGNTLVVRNKEGHIIFCHRPNAYNGAVERWLAYVLEHGKPPYKQGETK